MTRRTAAGVAALLAGALLAGPAAAQDREALANLEARIEALSRQTEAIAGQERRIRELEDAVRVVTGKMEENRHLLNQIHARLERMEQALTSPSGLPAPVVPGAGAPAPGSPPPPAPTVVTGTSSDANSRVPLAVLVPTTPPVPVQVDDEEAEYQRAYDLLGAADYAGAEAAFQAFIRKYPNSSLTDNAYYWLGESHYVRDQYEEAAAQFARGFRNAPEQQKAPDILLKLGLSLIALGKNADACATFDRLQQDYPDTARRTLDRAEAGRASAGCN